MVATRHNIDQLDDFAAARRRVRSAAPGHPPAPFGPGRRRAGTSCTPPRTSSAELYRWLIDRPDVLTGDSFFHLSALGEPLPGLNLCGAGRVVCLIDPVGDVYACPFVIHDRFLAGNVRDPGRLRRGLATQRAVRRAAPARKSRSLCLLRQLRRLPGRVHGVQVLRRARPDRPRPRVRAGQRRTTPGCTCDWSAGWPDVPRPGADHFRPGVPVPSPVTLRPTRRVRG